MSLRRFAMASLIAIGMLPVPAAATAAPSPAAKAGEYIVTVRDQSQPAREYGRELGGTVLSTWEKALRGFAIRLPEGGAAALARHPDVVRVSPNTTGVRLAECLSRAFPCPIETSTTKWNLDYIDARHGQRDNKYHTDVHSNGSGVTVYVLDSGLGEQTGVPLGFSGRATRGPNFRHLNGNELLEYPWSDSRDSDCAGHGTDVASIIGADGYGVSAANIVAIRVMSACDHIGGSFVVGDVVDGIEWILEQHNPGDRAVINFSATATSGSAELDAAFTNAINAGIPVVASAGNANADTCTVASPQRLPRVIVVGAHTQSGAKADFSNYGSCVDVYAPGVSVPSLDHHGESGTFGGTSAAAPHVAGVVARMMEEFELLPPTPDEVQASIKRNATTMSSSRKNLHASWFRQPSGTCDVSKENSANVNIPDGGQVESTIQIGQCLDDHGLQAQRYYGVISVTYTVVHGLPADLKLELVAPPSWPNPARVYPLGSGSPYGSGVIRIQLDAAESRNGAWKLRVKDRTTGYTGYLDRWSIQF